MENAILLELPKEDIQLVDELKRMFPDSVVSVSSEKFDASIELTELVLSLTIGTIPFITKIVIELIRARKHIKIKHKGLEVVGISEKNAEQLLRQIIDQEVNKSKK